jgi:CRISPR-associated endonuclease/helicase Cas3
MDFDAFFEKATDNRPFPYQRCLALNEPLYQLLDVPTGAGKTAAVILAWLWRRRFAEEAVRQATPRRLVYCLPMRTLVEQTEAAAQTWLRNLGQDTDVRVYVLMGGEEVEDWDISHPGHAPLSGSQPRLRYEPLSLAHTFWPAQQRLSVGP